MKIKTPRLRMFAGPNGSGKSTIKSMIRTDLLGTYVNPDEIEKQVIESGFLNLHHYQVSSTEEEIIDYFSNSSLLKTANLLEEVKRLQFQNQKLIFEGVGMNAYFASVASDFIRNKLLESSKSFTFETVMSFPDKIELLQKAQAMGYRTYLYYVATDDPSINIGRIAYRVNMGGHSVPEDKVVSRYYRSLELLIDAVKFSNRSYIFDNSTHEHIWLAQITDGKILETKTELMPAWFKKFLWDKFCSNVIDR